MKSYTELIILGIFVNYLNYLIATMLNFVNLKSASYEKINQYYSYLDYKKMSLYAQARSRAEIIAVFFSVVALLAFWLFSGFRILDDFVRSLPTNFIFQSSVYLIIILTFFIVLRLLYEIYLNFYLDKKYRISRMKFKEFAIENAKRSLIYYIIAGIIAISIFTSHILFGQNFWWVAWIVASILIISYSYLYPMIYLKFLNTINNAVDPNLRNKILNFCQEIDFPISNINIFESSKRTNRLNAFFAGFGKNKNIIISDSIINNFTDEEILAVIGHEAGHNKLNHNIANISIAIALIGIVLFLLSIFTTDITIFKSFYVYNLSLYVGLALYSVLIASFSIVVLPLINYHLRKNEQRADEFSLNHTRNKDTYISAITKVYKKNLYNPVPHPYYVFFYYKRNPAEQRIKYIENYFEKISKNK